MKSRRTFTLDHAQIATVLLIGVLAIILAMPAATFGQQEQESLTTKPKAAAANLQLSFNPDPAPASTTQACFGVTPAWLFSATIKETAGVGVTITGFTTSFYDSNNNLISQQTNTAADFATLFALTAPHISAKATVTGNECAHLAGRTAGKLIQVFSGVDDNGNHVSTTCGATLTLLGPLGPGPDLHISLVASGDDPTQSIAVAGQPLLYTSTITNQGSGVATGVTMTMPIPNGTTFDSVTSDQGSCTAPVPGASNSVNCAIGTIGPGSMARVWVLLNVTGRVTPVTASATTAASLTDPDPGEDTAVETSTVISSDGLTRSDMSLTTNGPSGAIASGTRATYSVTLKNVGTADTSGFGLVDFLPAGTTFFSINAQGQACTTPPPGGAGVVVCGIDQLRPGDQRVVQLTVNVLSPSGSSLLDSAKLIQGAATEKIIGACGAAIGLTPSLDVNPANNVGTTGALVQGGGTVALSWQEPAPTATQPTPAPFDLQAKPQLTAAVSDRSVARRVLPADSGSCTLTDIDIYKSDNPDVTKIDPATGTSNLWMTVPPDQVQTTMAAAPGGSFYAIANLWNCGGMTVESGLSNEQNSSGTLTAPQITNVEPMGTKHLLIEGQNFSSTAVITANGTPQTTLVQTPGTVLFGKKLLKRLRKSIGSGNTVTLRVDNGGGALSNEYTYTIP